MTYAVRGARFRSRGRSRVSAAKAVAISGLTSVVTLVACSQDQKPPGQLVVALDTDMALPDQIDTIEIEVIVRGTTLLDYPMPVGTGPDAQPIPATLTLVAGPDPTVPATIRVVGSKNGIARTLRQVITTVPTDRVATLRMPVQWLCDGTAQPIAGAEAGMAYQSTCGPDATCEAGECVASQVQESTLANYQAQSVFGGGSAPAAKGQTTGTCFDTIPCMVSGVVEAPDDQCTVNMPTGGAGVNVALRVADDGICDTTGTTCFVPLDGSSSEGWTEQNGRVALPPAVCTKLRSGLIAGVVVSTTCATKTEADPPCGPWSSVTPTAVEASVGGPDATALPATPTLVGAAAPAGGTSAACCPLLADSHTLYTCLCSGSSPVQIVAIDPSSGNTTAVASFTPQAARTEYAAVLAGGEVDWVDRLTSSDAGDECPVFGTSPADGGTGGPTAVVHGDVYDGADYWPTRRTSTRLPTT